MSVSICPLCTFPIVQSDDQQLIGNQQLIHKKCLPSQSPLYTLMNKLHPQENEKEDGNHDNSTHSSTLYKRLLQLYFTVMTRTSHLIIDANGCLRKRCHPIFGCNIIKPIVEFDVANYDGNDLMLDASRFQRRCRSCSLQSIINKKERQRKTRKTLKDLLLSEVHVQYDLLLSIVQNSRIDDLKSKIDDWCLTQWQLQKGKCAHCSLHMARGMRGEPDDLSTSYVDGLCATTFRYTAATHNIEWIHEHCGPFYKYQSEMFADLFHRTHQLVFEDSEHCLCTIVRLPFADLMKRLIQSAAPFVAVLKNEPIWCKTWKQYRTECGDEAFQDVATCLLEMQQKK